MPTLTRVVSWNVTPVDLNERAIGFTRKCFRRSLGSNLDMVGRCSKMHSLKRVKKDNGFEKK